MPIEVKINFSRSTMELPDVKPGTNAIVPDSVNSHILVIECYGNDKGGKIIRTESDSIQAMTEDGAVIKVSDPVEVIDIENNGKYKDFVGVCEGAPIIIGELVVQHITNQD